MPIRDPSSAQNRDWAAGREDERRLHVSMPAEGIDRQVPLSQQLQPPYSAPAPASASRTSSSSSCDLSREPVSGLGSDALIQVLALDSNALLNTFTRRVAYGVVHGTARLLPAVVIYGGTFGLLTCAVFKYRWGLLLALTLYTVYMGIQCMAFCVFSFVGICRVWADGQKRWHGEYLRWRDSVECFGEQRPLSEEWKSSSSVVDWEEVFHVVMLPSYRTPVAVLEESLRALEKYESARTCMGVVLAFEQREEAVVKKATQLQANFESKFRFLALSFHPPDVPGHIPGKSSNECWAFQHVCQDLLEHHGLHPHDPRVVVTVMDDDSEFHENYFEALTFHFATTPASTRYTTTWQPPICHMKNYLRQPLVVRVSSFFATLSELAYLANPFDCHVNYSSYSLSLALASAAGGWDPDYLAEDWHMFAKCSLMTSGRARCVPIFLPLMNYTPETETYLGTCLSRWDQAKRHALGVSELVYAIQGIFLGMLELRGVGPRLTFLWRLCPLVGKFTQVHFVNGMSAVLAVLAQVIIHLYMWRFWCYVSLLSDDARCELLMHSATQEGIAQEQIVLNSWMVHWQQRITAVMAVAMLLSGGIGVLYFQLVRDRVEGDLSKRLFIRHPLLHWLNVQVSIMVVGWLSSLLYGAAPLWIAVSRIVCEAKFTHVVAGMAGRSLKFDT